ncbi:MAG: hypothetical protein JWN90_461 [Parcubacteria group bacterium]|nr:hypothetical protein [Parcubacteria group bacterium]
MSARAGNVTRLRRAVLDALVDRDDRDQSGGGMRREIHFRHLDHDGLLSTFDHTPSLPGGSLIRGGSRTIPLLLSRTRLTGGSCG